MNDSEQNESPGKPQPKLAAALRAMPRNSVFVPSAVDQAILAKARQQIERQALRPGRSRIVPWLAWAAVLVALVALSGLRRPSTNALALDVNGDGRFDILDAFALARQLEKGTRPEARLDLNHDGVIDDRDVQVLAAKAVDLTGGATL